MRLPLHLLLLHLLLLHLLLLLLLLLLHLPLLHLPLLHLLHLLELRPLLLLYRGSNRRGRNRMLPCTGTDSEQIHKKEHQHGPHYSALPTPLFLQWLLLTAVSTFCAVLCFASTPSPCILLVPFAPCLLHRFP
jgi:hypothetical protein